MDHLNSHRIRSINNDRVEKFLSKEEWTDINLYSALYPKRDSKSVHLKVFSITDIDPNETDRVSYKDAIKGDYKDTKVGESFGPSWTTHWFKVDITLPEGWECNEIHFIWDSESEAMVWDKDQPQQLLNGSNGNDRRDFYILTDNSKPNDKWSFYIEMSCNAMFGNPGPCGFLCPTDPNRYFKLKKAEIAIFSRKAWNLYRDLSIIYEISTKLPKEDIRSWRAAEYCRKIVNATYTDNPKSFDDAQKLADEFLNFKNGDTVHKVTAVGHCHIDTAWLWPYSETRRKCARSWSTQCLLMDRYKDYKFAASQAQQYEWMKIKYPELYDRIKAKVKSGNFIPIGGTWVEMDCNVPSGESFVRQFLVGQSFFKNEFGITCEIFWLPDTFGYSSQLPQIIKKSGCKYFLTQKLSWNNINKFPHSTFRWEGLDGTQVLSHFPPADTYNSEANVKELVFSMNNFKTKDKSNESLMLYGWGDGGGGPDYGHLERLSRLKDVDGVPKVELGHPTDFFKSVESNESELPVWSGELYFEFHRGTYTTHARTKKGNRKSEFSLQMLEIIGTLSTIHSSHEYPKDELLRLWKLVLINQFHDVLPGTSINLVYKDAEKYYKEVLESSEKLTTQAIMSILNSKKGKGGRVSIFNSLGWERKEIVDVPNSLTVEGKSQESNGKSLAIVTVPPLGFVTNVQLNGLNENTEPARIVMNSDGSVSMSNQYISCTFNKEGQMISLFHKATNREAIAPNSIGNKFVLFEDIPIFWDAWDVEIYHTEKPVPMVGVGKPVEIKEKGPLRVSFEFTYIISEKSKIMQTVYLDALSEYPVFDTKINWHENRKFLKVEFAWDVYSPHAYYSTHFGCLSRPTHKNTTWDLAKFEVCGHHWADLSEYGFGVALLNDCKNGYSCERNVMRLSLLRSSKHPDPEADMGEQSFKYATLPHKGNHSDADLVRHGFIFNVPLKVIVHDVEVQRFHYAGAWTRSPNIVLETLKKSENGQGLILRLWESYGGRGCADVFIAIPFKEVYACNLLEEKIEGVNLEISEGVESKIVKVPYKPFEIVTLFLKN